MSSVAPDRLQSLDTVRGVAVMGILLLNIVAFAMPTAAYFNPRAYGGAEGADLAVYLVNFVLFDGKMRGLFSFLFGASMLLVIDRAEAKGESAARVHYARMVWLLIFGLAHLWLVWWGDILNLYALVGMIAFAFRGVRTRTMIVWGVGLVLAQCAMVGMLAVTVATARAGLDSPNPETARQAAKTLAEFAKGFGVPPAEVIAKDLAEHRGGYGEVLVGRLKAHGFSPISSLLLFGWETLAYMLFGMAAFRSGLLTGSWPRSRYLLWAAIGLGIGIPVYVAIAAWLVAQQFDMVAVITGVLALATPVRPVMIVGWACLILLLMRPGGVLTSRIAAAGRMAFTNYLATSLICSTLFYGYGLGWYGHLSRAQLYLVVLGVCALMLLWSKPWLARFRYGPFEWLWRSLARRKLQPMRGSAAAIS